MNQVRIRQIQAICFGVSHIPLAATLAVLASDGLDDDLRLLGVVFGATVVAAVTLIVYLGRALSPGEAKLHGVTLG